MKSQRNEPRADIKMDNLKTMNLFCLFTLAIFAQIESVPIETEGM